MSRFDLLPQAHGTLYHPTRRDWPSIPDPDDSWMLDRAFEATAD